MKKALLCTLASALLTGSAWAQSYELTVRVPDTEKNLIIYHFGSRQKDTVAVTRPGLYTTAGDAGGDLFVEVATLDYDINVKAVLDGKVEVDLIAGTATGTPENEALTRCEKEFASWEKENQGFLEEYAYASENGLVTDSLMEAFATQYQEFTEQSNEKLLGYCRQYTSHLFPAIYLSEIGYTVDRECILALADLHPAYLHLPMMDDLTREFDSWRKQAVGTPFTDLEMADPTGTMHKLSEFLGRGNYVLVDFWASWCGPCRDELPHVKAAYEIYHEKGLDIVGISLDKKKENWTAAIEEFGLPWHHLSDLKGWESQAAQIYGIHAIPDALLFGPDGRIVAVGLRGIKIFSALMDIYKD